MMKQYKKLLAVLTLLCFAMTLMPVAAFAVPSFNYQNAYVYTSDEGASEKTVTSTDEANLGIKFDFSGATTDSMYVWFIKSGNNVPVTAVTAPASQNGNTISKDANGIFHISGNIVEGEEYLFAFENAGSYSVYAAVSNPANVNESTLASKIANVEGKLDNLSDFENFEITTSSPSNLYSLQLIDNAGLAFTTDSYGFALLNTAVENGGVIYVGAGLNLRSEGGVNNHLATNGVASDDITFKLVDKDGNAVRGATVKLSTSNTNCVLNKETATTNTLGQFSFTIAITEESPNTDGFTIYIESGSYEAKLIVTASSTGAHDLTFTKMPTVALSTDDCTEGSTLDDIWVAVKDVNGNFVKPFALQPGGEYAEPGFAGVKDTVDLVNGGDNFSDVDYTTSEWGKSAENYVSIVSQPAASDLENKDIWLCPVGQDAPYQNTLYTKKDLVAGEYTLKLTLANGKYKTITFTVAEMGTPVGITITPKAAVTELGSKTSASFKLVDANGVGCDALKKGVDVSVNGYGVLKTVNGYENQNGAVDNDDNTLYIYTKNDDKYAGSEIKIIATSDRYNLVGESTITLTSGNAFIYIPVSEAKINTPTDITYLLMDGQNMMNISVVTNSNEKVGDTDIINTGAIKVVGGQTSFVVKAKPEGATVNFDARAAGGAATSITGDSYAVGRIECDKPGVVTVQMTLGVQILQEDGTWSPRYYTGTQNIVFSDGSIGKTVVMSIGSSEIVVDGEKANIDAAPIVQNSRTYVPFRALAEAFGAEVAYDEATQAVTATLGSNTVVMTIGSATYTVNGEEKTADVAPFISGGRTMVPVRFAAEAFGSTVIPTYDDNGATADVLFKL